LLQVAEQDKPGGQNGGFVSFTAGKDDVRKWLEASLSTQHLQMGDKSTMRLGTRWLYPAPNQCWIHVETAEGGRERVIAYWRTRILIAE
jgi:hypothetical protein